MLRADFLPQLLNRTSVKDFSRALRAGRTHLRKESVVILLCGASVEEGNSSARNSLLLYFQRHLLDYKFFLAEKVFSALQKSLKKDLLSLEDELASYCDCIILLLESPGAIAELGAFTIKDQIARIVLPVNDIEYRNEGSFISDGPIQKLDKVSKFKPTIYVDFKRITRVASLIEQKLSPLKRNRVRPVDISKFRKLSENRKNKLLFVADLITMFSPISFPELIDLIKKLYGVRKNIGINVELGILKAIGVIGEGTIPGLEREESYFFKSASDLELYYRYSGASHFKIRADVVNHYHKYSRGRMQVLALRANS